MAALARLSEVVHKAGIEPPTSIENMHPRQRHRCLALPSLLAAAGALLAGCGFREPSLADRCGEMMLQAFPDGDIEVTGKRAAADPTAPTRTVIITQVEGIRTSLPQGALARRDIAVECRFDNGILTGFRWTAGPLS